MTLSALGNHDLQGWPAGCRWSAVANVTKSVGNTAAIRAAPAHAVTVFRWPFSETEQTDILNQAIGDPRGAAERVVATIVGALAGFNRDRLYCELLNEVGKGRRTEYAALCREAIPLLHAQGLLAAGPSWATGDYEQDDWDLFAPLGWDALALHAYWSTAGFTQWNALRWRTYWRDGDPLVLVTECGRDRVRDGDIHVNDGWLPLDNSGKYGWQAASQNCTREQYLAELDGYNAELQNDWRVIGGTVFTTSPTDDWRDKGFSCDEIADTCAANTMPWTPRGGESPVLTGIDVASYQGIVDWEKVAAAGHRFGIAKASGDEGGGNNEYIEGTFPRNWNECLRVGIVPGAYHYARPSVASPAQSVTTFQKSIARIGGDVTGGLIALDMEDPGVPAGQSLLQWTAEWLALAEQVFGVRPLIYTGKYYIDEHGLGDPGIKQYPLWLASYQDTPPPVPTAWDRYVIWQYSANGRVNGIAGDVDMNRFYGGEGDLRALTKQEVVASDPIPTAEGGPPPEPRIEPSIPDPIAVALDNVQRAVDDLRSALGR